MAKDESTGVNSPPVDGGNATKQRTGIGQLGLQSKPPKYRLYPKTSMEGHRGIQADGNPRVGAANNHFSTRPQMRSWAPKVFGARSAATDLSRQLHRKGFLEVLTGVVDLVCNESQHTVLG